MANRYAPEVRAGADRRVFEHQSSNATQAGAIAGIAPKIGRIPQPLRNWVNRAEKDSGMHDGIATDERDRIKAHVNLQRLHFGQLLISGGPLFQGHG